MADLRIRIKVRDAYRSRVEDMLTNSYPELTGNWRRKYRRFIRKITRQEVKISEGRELTMPAMDNMQTQQAAAEAITTPADFVENDE